MSDRTTDWVPPMLRTVGTVTLALCAVALPLTFLPSVRVYHDANDCFGRIFAAHGGSGCGTSWVLEKTLHPGVPAIACLVIIALGAFAMRRRPHGLAAFVGSLPAIALCGIGALRAIDFEIFSFDHREVLATAQILALLFGLIALIATAVFVISPVVGIARMIERRRAARPVPLPSARVAERD